MKVLIVQPWFTAFGHPAQSLLNTARALGPHSDVEYMIADPGDGAFAASAGELEQYGKVARFRSSGDGLRSGTLRSLPAIVRMARRDAGLRHVFFLDAHMVALAAAWPLLAPMLHNIRVSAIYLGGPESIVSHAISRALVSRFLSTPGRRVLLRTTELRQAWREAFPDIPGNRIETIPSLELANDAGGPPPFRSSMETQFGVVGQVRPGKSLEWLVPLFAQNPGLGTLNIAGTFTNPEHEQRMSFLSGYANFDNRYLSEGELHAVAAAQDYLLSLYEDWDARMEAATVYLAASVRKPVIVYDDGWPGRMMREFGCGVAVPRSNRPDRGFFKNLPQPGDARYQAFLEGIERFRAAHGGVESCEAFLRVMFDE